MQLLFEQILWHSTSISIPCPTLPVHSTGSYAELLHYKLYAMCQYDQCKSTGEIDTHMNIDEIDTSSQFHQHFMSSFSANIFAPKNYKAKL